MPLSLFKSTFGLGVKGFLNQTNRVIDFTWAIFPIKIVFHVYKHFKIYYKSK